jgi:hypothetical protein
MSTVVATTRSSQALAPEDIRVGDFVGLLQASVQYPTYLWHGDLPSHHGPEECVRVSFMPCDGGVPLKVKAVSLPFILVKAPGQNAETLDVRLCRVARLDADYAATAWAAFKKPIVKARKRAKKRKK